MQYDISELNIISNAPTNEHVCFLSLSTSLTEKTKRNSEIYIQFEVAQYNSYWLTACTNVVRFPNF